MRNRSNGVHAMDPTTTLVPLLCSVTYKMRRLRQRTPRRRLGLGAGYETATRVLALWGDVALDTSSICFLAQLQMVLN